MHSSKQIRFIMIALVILITVNASARQRVGPVGDTGRNGPDRGLEGQVLGSVTATTVSQCFSWKLGDQNQSSGTTWVSSSNAYLYSGAGLTFKPNKPAAPEALTPGPDLAGVIGVGFTNPAYIPTSIEIAYSFLPVSRSSSSASQPAPAKIGLAWFNSYGPGSTFPASEQTVTVYPVFGRLNYNGVFGWNPNTRYLVYVKTGNNGGGGSGGDDAFAPSTSDDDNGGSGNNRGFAAAGVICFTRIATHE